MLRQVTAKKIVDDRIVGFWSQRHGEEEEEYADLEQIYEFAVRNLDDIKAGRMTREESSQYGIMQPDEVMVIAISKENGTYTINHMDGGDMKEALDKLPVRE